MDKTLKKKSQEFATKTVKLHKHLSAIKKETVMSEELLRCGAGAGAELAKAEFAMGNSDQTAKIYKALHNCVEAKYWLELLFETDYITEFEFKDSIKSCDELGALIIALVKTIRAKHAKN